MRLHGAFAGERGTVLVIALLVIALLIGAGAAAIVSVQTDLKTSANLSAGTRAFYIAEAGLSHAVNELRNRDAAAGFDRVLGMSAGALIVSNANFAGGTYQVTRLKSASRPSRIQALAVGTAPNQASSEIEAWLRKEAGRPPRTAMTNGELKISGDPQLVGLCGGAQANDDMLISGNPAAQMALGFSVANADGASGLLPEGMNITGSPCIGSAGCFRPPGERPSDYTLDTADKRSLYEAASYSRPFEIPTINPADYAKHIGSLGEAGGGTLLHADGRVTAGPGVICDAGGFCAGGVAVPRPPGWSYASGVWTVAGGAPLRDGIFYAETKVEISGAIGSAGVPWQATIVARDSIRISGDIYLRPYPTPFEPLQNQLLVTGNDLEIDANFRADYAGGALLAHQQVKIGGSGKITGFILAGDGRPTWPGDPFPDSSSGLALNEISGSPTIEFSCDFGCFGPGCPAYRVAIVGWQQKF